MMRFLTNAAAGNILKGYPKNKRPAPILKQATYLALRQRMAGIATTLGAIALMLMTALPAHATSLYEMPIVSSGDSTWVVDEAEIISRANEGRLSRDLGALAEESGSEVRLVTIRRLDYGETVQSFTDKLFEKWYPTPDEQSNQVLMVLDNVTNNVAIHIGDGVTDRLSAEIAESVAQETALAPLREDDKYNQAFLDVSDRLVAVLSGQPDPGPPAVEEIASAEGTFASAEETEKSNATVIVVGFLVAATIIPMATYYLYQIIQS
ncbi:MAG: TPM domain-containing protein [Elainellaceae cyanobacterium]